MKDRRRHDIFQRAERPIEIGVHEDGGRDLERNQEQKHRRRHADVKHDHVHEE